MRRDLSAQLSLPEFGCARRRTNILLMILRSLKSCWNDFESGLGMTSADFLSVDPFIESDACFTSEGKKIVIFGEVIDP
jgi:hypothetical protein